MMEKNGVKSSIKLLVAFTFVLMILVNALANILPINGVNSGEVSDFYTNLFAPAGVTFSIWGVIYLLLFVYTLYQLGIFQDKKTAVKVKLLEKVGILFAISSLANTAWIFSWHYKLIPLSFLFILVILGCLIFINRLIMAEKLEVREKLLIALPFSIYFGWITVATIANATTLLVSIGWNGFGISAEIWTVIVLIVGLLIGVITILRNKDFAYGLVFIWAYVGILIKHISADGFSGMYPVVILTVSVCLVFFTLAEFNVLFLKNKFDFK